MCGAEVASDESTFVAVCAAQGRPEEAFGHFFAFYSLTCFSYYSAPVEEVRVTRLLTATVIESISNKLFSMC